MGECNKMELNCLVFVALMMMMVISTVNGFGGKKPTEAPCSRSYECATGLCVGYACSQLEGSDHGIKHRSRLRSWGRCRRGWVAIGESCHFNGMCEDSYCSWHNKCTTSEPMGQFRDTPASHRGVNKPWP